MTANIKKGVPHFMLHDAGKRTHRSRSPARLDPRAIFLYVVEHV